MAAKKTETEVLAENTTASENRFKSEQAVTSLTKEEKRQKTENTETVEAGAEAEEETFIYIGPTTRTGLIENTIFTGTKKSIEEHLKDTIKVIPQVKQLIVETKNLAKNKVKVKKTGTILNKYYNDVLSLSRKAKEE